MFNKKKHHCRSHTEGSILPHPSEDMPDRSGNCNCAFGRDIMHSTLTNWSFGERESTCIWTFPDLVSYEKPT